MIKKLYSLISILFVASSVNAQFTSVWEVPWQHTAANNYSNEGRKVVMDASGNSYVLADATSNINLNGQTVTATQYYVAVMKYNPNGNLLASRYISVRGSHQNGYDHFNAFGMEIDGSGNLYIGYSRYESATNLRDIYITKLNGNTLNNIWNNHHSFTSDDRGVELRVSGGVAYALVKSTFGSTVIYRVLKGNSTTTSTTGLFEFLPGYTMNSIEVDASQNIYSVGYRTVQGSSTKIAVALRHNSSGTLLWERPYSNSGNGDAWLNRAHLSPDNFLYAIGTRYNSNLANNDALLIKFNLSNGNEVWSRSLHRNNDNGLFVLTASSGSVVYAAAVANNSVFVDRYSNTGAKGPRGIFIPKPSSPYNSVLEVAFNDLKISASGKLYLAGHLRANVNPGGNYLAGWAARFSYLSSPTESMKLDFYSDILGEPNLNSSFKSLALDILKSDVMILSDVFYPFSTHLQETVVLIDYDVPSPLRQFQNPGNQSLSVWFNSDEKAIRLSADVALGTIQLFDITGRLVSQFMTSDNTQIIDAGWLPAGVCFIRVQNQTGVTTRKVMIK